MGQLIIRLLAKPHLLAKMANFFKQSKFCKKSILILMLAGIHTCAAEEASVQEQKAYNYQELMAPLMSLSEQPPVTVDLANRRKYLKHTELDQKAAVQFFSQKNFPWISLLSFLIVAAAIALIRGFPPPVAKSTPAPAGPGKEERMQQLSALINTPPSRQKNWKPYLIQLDWAVREYIQNHYQVPLTRYTTEEFLQDALRNPSMDETTRLNILLFLQNMDRIKFARSTPEKEESQEAIKLAATIIQRDRPE